MKSQLLNGNWNMKEIGQNISYHVNIPGSVLSCLLDNEIIEDPYFRDNEPKIRDLFWQDYEFTRIFEVDDTIISEDVIELVCYGLDTIGEIYINEQHIGNVNNMHRTWRFSVKEYLRIGTNSIRIIFRSTLEYIKNYTFEENKQVSYYPFGCMKGNQLIRKSHSMFGWDWGPQLPDAGIFRDIALEAYSEAKIVDVYIKQKHIENEVLVTIDTALQIIKEKQYHLEIQLLSPDNLEIAKAITEISDKNNSIEMKITEPKLWWPNGFGEQPLYQIKIRLKLDECCLDSIDEKEYTIGLRTLTVSQEKDEWGQEFAIIVNGIKIFTKGANYIPEDCIYSRITLDRIEYLIKSSVKANYNCLRVWGGGYYPSDEFYDLCDRYGLIVWQDLMFACNIYDVTNEFAENIVEEAKDNVSRIRHHACLGLWCGNNEIESAWLHWEDFQKESPYLRADYIKQFEYLLPKAVKETDPTTFFWPSSPSSGGCMDDPDDENRGDTHYWQVWHGLLPFSEYQNHYFRFCSEFGFQSFPCSKTVNTYTIAEDRNIFSYVMESHQKNNAANGKMLYYLSENFRYPKDFDSLLYVTQILQGLAIKSGVEHFRRNRGRCMGAIYWQINDNWPVASWSSIDYYGRWKALHYMARKFYAPISGSLVRHEDKIEAFIQNESLDSVSLKGSVTLKTMEFKILHKIEFDCLVDPLSVYKVVEKEYSDLIQGIKDTVFVELIIQQEEKREQIEIETFLPYKHLNLHNPNIQISVQEEEDFYKISMQSDTFSNFVELDFIDADVIFEENYFAISDSEPKVVILLKEDIINGSFQDAKELEKRLQIRTIRNSYDD